MPPERYLDLYDDVELPVAETLFDDLQDNASAARSQEMEIDRHMNMVYDLFLEPTRDWDPKSGKANDGSGFRNLKNMTADQRASWTAAYADENAEFRKANLTGEDLVRWKYQRYLKNYLRTAKAVDDSVGSVMKYLEESGLAENTIVIYSSDQGFYLGDHGWYDKRWMYEESLKMPLVVRWPGVTEPGSVNEQMVQNLDYAQTFLEITGVEAPSNMQGSSLVPLLRGEKPADWRQSIYYHYYGFPDVHRVARHYGIRTDRYKLIRFYQLGEWELYDLKSDPDELRNLYGNPEYRDIASKLAVQLGELKASYADHSEEGVK
jgi:arylsulfatase A-like enzyme